MRIISGNAKNRKLKTLAGEDIIRPTSEMLKEAIFSAIQFNIENSVVFDMFAGSGQLGIEALSRGAAKVVFADNNPQCIKIIKENLNSLSTYEFNYKIVNSPSQMYLKTHPEEKFDIALIDPPYGRGVIEKTLPIIAAQMNERGLIVCEHEKELALPKMIEGTSGFSVRKLYRHGKKSITIYHKATKEQGLDDL